MSYVKEILHKELLSLQEEIEDTKHYLQNSKNSVSSYTTRLEKLLNDESEIKKVLGE